MLENALFMHMMERSSVIKLTSQKENISGHNLEGTTIFLLQMAN